MNAKRKKFEEFVIQHYSTMDKSGLNVQRMKDMWAGMSDQQFDEWVKRLRDGKEKLAFLAPNMRVNIQIRDLVATADNLGLQLFERVKIWDSTTRRYYLTPEKYLICELPVRRVKQYLMDKISVPDSDRVVNPTTGQVVKPDKGSAISMTEAQTYDSKGLHRCLDELLIVRGGNLDAYASFKAALENGGEARLSELDYSGGVRSAVIAKVLLESMHIENNLV